MKKGKLSHLILKDMKTCRLILSMMLITSGASAQMADSQSAQASQQASPYTVVERGPHHRVWQRVQNELDPSGTLVPRVHQYTELATGLCYWNAATTNWQDSQEVIYPFSGGGAAATNGQHQAYFPYDIYSGAITLVGPMSGGRIQSRPLFLSYYDGSNSVLIAELTNSAGQILPAGNRVIYTNAFTDFAVDLLCVYRKGGFECDSVFRQKPPDPSAFGLDPSQTRLQLWTEFFNTPDPVQSVTQSNSTSLADPTFVFGTIRMGRGRAFRVGSTNTVAGPRVYKTWVHTPSGRTFLIEEVPYRNIAPQFAGLASTADAFDTAKYASAAGSGSRKFSGIPSLAEARPVGSSSRPLVIAKADLSRRPGVVLDYQTENYYMPVGYFQGDTTYYITGPVYFGNNAVTLEGNCVIKFAPNVSASLYGIQTLDCSKTGPYRPAVLTAQDDDTVGETIANSTHNPSGYYASTALDFTGWGNTLRNVRIAYANIATHYEPIDPSVYPMYFPPYYGGAWDYVRDVQILNCSYPFYLEGVVGDTSLYPRFLDVGNALVWNAYQGFSGSCFGGTVQNLTADGCYNLAYDSSGSGLNLGFINCVLSGSFNLGSGVALTGSCNGFYGYSQTFGSPCWTVNTSPFQTAGAGGHYLAADAFRNVGTTAVDGDVVAELKNKTTYPPTILSNVVVNVDTVLTPQAGRDLSATDLGYHYDPIDYLTYLYKITNAALTISNGTAIASYNTTGIWLSDGNSISAIGDPLNPIWFARYQSVQEQAVMLGNTSLSNALDVLPYYSGAGGPPAVFRFCNFTCPANGGTHLYGKNQNWTYSSLLVQDCQLWEGVNDISGFNSYSANVKNSLFYRSSLTASLSGLVNSSLALSNNLVYGISLSMGLRGTSSKLLLFDNDFDSCVFTSAFSCSNDHNAYINCTSRLNPSGPNDVLTNTLAYQVGPLGQFYQPSNSPLIDHGSVTANLDGLYHYTVLTQLVNGKEIKETNSIVDIGLHYVAVDSSGRPIDTDGDGIPDYLEDKNGNGLFDSGETDWQTADPPGVPGALQFPNGLKLLILEPKPVSRIP